MIYDVSKYIFYEGLYENRILLFSNNLSFVFQRKL